jgi:hypothetical protein
MCLLTLRQAMYVLQYSNRYPWSFLLVSMREIQSTGQTQESPGTDPDPNIKKRKNMNEIEQFEEQMQGLEAKNTELVKSKGRISCIVHCIE